MALPNGYTKLEYIESTGTQYISTGITPTENTKVVIEFNSSSSSGVVFGQDSGYKVNAFMFAMTVVVFDSTKKDISISANAKHTVQVAPKAFKVDNGSSQYIYANKVNAAYPMFLFGNNRKGKFSEGVAMKLYSFKVYENDVLIADYIPCKQGNAVGLYDDVAGAMNLPLGTGDFTAGPSISGTHKTLVGGTAYTVKGGKCMVNGTVYNILKGRTLIDGTGWDITLPAPLVMPVKGDLITMNLDGTDRLYRVLKIVDETTVEVLGMWNLSTSIAFGSSNAYSNSALDRYLNTTWYNTLSIAAKAAIVPKTITQDSWFFGTSGSPQYSGTYGTTSPGTFSYTISLYSQENLSVGNQYVYAMSVQDVLDYLSDTNVLVDTSGMLRNRNIWKMFWNKTSTGNGDIWLRSKDADSQTRTCIIDAGYGSISSWAISKTAAARPAFQIDLSKIDFTIGGGNVSKTWRFNDAISCWDGMTWNVNFVALGYPCTAIYSTYRNNLLYTASIGGIMARDAAGNWNGEEYRTVTFDEAPSGNLLTWLQANATPQ